MIKISQIYTRPTKFEKTFFSKFFFNYFFSQNFLNYFCSTENLDQTIFCQICEKQKLSRGLHMGRLLLDIVVQWGRRTSSEYL